MLEGKMYKAKDQFDATILYSKVDDELATGVKKLFCQYIELEDGEPVKICIIDEDLPECQNDFKHLDEALQRSTFIFILLTEETLDDEWVQFQKFTSLYETFQEKNKRDCVIPIVTKPKLHRVNRKAFGIRHIKGFDISELNPYILNMEGHEAEIKKICKKRFEAIKKLLDSKIELRHEREMKEKEKANRSRHLQETEPDSDLTNKLSKIIDHPTDNDDSAEISKKCQLSDDMIDSQESSTIYENKDSSFLSGFGQQTSSPDESSHKNPSDQCSGLVNVEICPNGKPQGKNPQSMNDLTNKNDSSNINDLNKSEHGVRSQDTEQNQEVDVNSNENENSEESMKICNLDVANKVEENKGQSTEKDTTATFSGHYSSSNQLTKDCAEIDKEDKAEAANCNDAVSPNLELSLPGKIELCAESSLASESLETKKTNKPYNVFDSDENSYAGAVGDHQDLQRQSMPVANDTAEQDDLYKFYISSESSVNDRQQGGLCHEREVSSANSSDVQQVKPLKLPNFIQNESTLDSMNNSKPLISQSQLSQESYDICISDESTFNEEQLEDTCDGMEATCTISNGVQKNVQPNIPKTCSSVIATNPVSENQSTVPQQYMNAGSGNGLLHDNHLSGNKDGANKLERQQNTASSTTKTDQTYLKSKHSFSFFSKPQVEKANLKITKPDSMSHEQRLRRCKVEKEMQQKAIYTPLKTCKIDAVSTGVTSIPTENATGNITPARTAFHMTQCGATSQFPSTDHMDSTTIPKSIFPLKPSLVLVEQHPLKTITSRGITETKTSVMENQAIKSDSSDHMGQSHSTESSSHPSCLVSTASANEQITTEHENYATVTRSTGQIHVPGSPASSRRESSQSSSSLEILEPLPSDDADEAHEAIVWQDENKKTKKKKVPTATLR